ncbi:MAG: glycosyltransferase, partial [Chloroflexota bacterium]
MFRREMWVRSGGYKQVYHPAEDAEFWLRGLSLGFTAKRVTNEPLMLYRHHADSASRTKPQRNIHTWHNFATDKQYPFAAPSEVQPVIRSYSSPDISVIIPVGTGHEELVTRAIDSVIGQSFRNWELVVIDDAPTGDPYSCLFSTLGKSYPFIKRVYGDFRVGSIGQAAARNKGLVEAEAPLVLFLDADDWLMPTALEKMFEAYQKATHESCYIYPDWHNFKGTELIPSLAKETYSQKRLLEKLIHPVTVLMRKEDAVAVGGFDTTLNGFEDWDFFCKLAVRGVCGIEVNEKLLSYQTEAGTQRKKSYENKDAVVSAIIERYKEYSNQEGGKKIMACGSCGGGRKAEVPKQDNTPKEGEILIKYTGNNPTPI